MSSRRITLALGGGGARGVAHLGVAQTLIDAGYVIDRIVGISIGSLAGAMLAFEPDIQKTQSRAVQFLMSPSFRRHQELMFGAAQPTADEGGGLFNWYDKIKHYLRGNRLMYRVATRPGLLPALILQDVTERLLPEADIRDARIPLSIVAIDLRSGQRVILNSGPLRPAVQGSSAIPGIFPPVEYDGMELCDVGVLCSVPAVEARGLSDSVVVAVEVATRITPIRGCSTALDVLMRVDEVGEVLFRRYVRAAADIVIRPDVDHIPWFDFTRPQSLIDAGRRAATRVLRQLDDLFRRRERGLQPRGRTRTAESESGATEPASRADTETAL